MAKTLVCTRCKAVGLSKNHTKGSILIEIVLWCMFILPGLVYSLWRLTTRHLVCRMCGSAELVPLASPRGRELSLT